jgi:hypothetical protein
MIQPNYRRGTRYFYVHSASLACVHLGLGESFRVYTKRPSPASEFHRVELNVVRTKAEARALERKWAKVRAQRASQASS